jgi:hypothetical protein
VPSLGSTGVTDTLWTLEGIAEKIKANRPHPGDRGLYTKRETFT